MQRHGRISFLATALVLAGVGFVGFAPTVAGEEPERKGGWLIEKDEQSSIRVHTMEMTLHPRAEPRPALRYRLIPDDYDMLDGNAAPYYLLAMGFMEQNSARDALRERYKEASEQTRREGKKVPPYSWLDMRPEQLPLKEVHKFLNLTSFQPRSLKEAARRRWFDMDRNFREVEDPYAYLIPEIQSMRELARMQALRCKVAIAEGRTDDAVEILGQQYALGRHLGQDEFLVSALVGCAIAGIGWNDMLYLVQHADAPNLYWALASIPRPLVDLRHAMGVERQMIALTFKSFQEVDETPRPAGYWRDFLDRQVPNVTGLLASEFGIPWNANDPEMNRAMLVGFVAAAYPSAKRYLIEDLGMPAERVEAYPTAQVVFLAMVRFYNEARDDTFKWSHLPYWQAESKTGDFRFEDFLQVKTERVGWSAAPTDALLPSVLAARTAATRIEQQLALVQTVEAIRMHGAANGGKLPKTLDEMAVPAPVEPFTGQPLDYRHQGDHAVLTGHKMPGIQYRLTLRFAKEAK